MSEFENPLDKLRAQRKSRQIREQFANPLDNVDATKRAKAVGDKRVAGSLIRFSLRVTPEQESRVKALAQEWHVSLNDVFLWLIDQGLWQVEQGQEPEWKTVNIKRKPKLNYE